MHNSNSSPERRSWIAPAGGALIITIAAALVALAAASEFRTWTDSSGKFKTEAKFVSGDGDKVTLERRDGTQIDVDLQRLSEADRRYVAAQKTPRAPGKPSIWNPFAAARASAARSQCSNNLKQIGLALHNYHDTYKCFPPAVITDKEGKPMRSWRVAVLPYLEEYQLYKRYDFRVPWDSPKNAALADPMPEVFRCPADTKAGKTETNYVMIVGPNTVGGTPNEAVSLAKITDGSSNTIAVVEVVGSGIHWMEPRDLTVDELAKRVNEGGKGPGGPHAGGIQVLMCDGSAHFLTEELTPELLRQLLIRNDGKPLRRPF